MVQTYSNQLFFARWGMPKYEQRAVNNRPLWNFRTCSSPLDNHFLSLASEMVQQDVDRNTGQIPKKSQSTDPL
jgi:hypothetical protein